MPIRKFLFAVTLGVGIGYVFHNDIDKLLRAGLDRANEVVDQTSETPTTEGALS